MIKFKFSGLIENTGLSYREISKLTGVSHVTLMRLAKAKSHLDYNVTVDILEKLSRYFKCKSITELIEIK